MWQKCKRSAYVCLSCWYPHGDRGGVTLQAGDEKGATNLTRTRPHERQQTHSDTYSRRHLLVNHLTHSVQYLRFHQVFYLWAGVGAVV